MSTPAQFLTDAYCRALFSNDPSTQLGAVVVADDGRIIGVGYNRFAAGVQETHARLHDRDQKLPRTCHAEVCALLNAVKHGYARELPRATLYCPWYACDRCAVVILELGIKHVVGHSKHPGFADANGKWAQLVETGLEMLLEGNVVCERHDIWLPDAPDIRFSGKHWSPRGPVSELQA